MEIKKLENFLDTKLYNKIKKFNFFLFNKNFSNIVEINKYLDIYNFSQEQKEKIKNIYKDEGNSIRLENEFNKILKNVIEIKFDLKNLENNFNKNIINSQEGFKKHLDDYNNILYEIDIGLKKYNKEKIDENGIIELKQIENKLNLL